MIPSNPDVLDHLIRDRQDKLRATPRPSPAPAGNGLRVRIGHALIVAGSTISGEQVEPARHSPTPRAA
jgi:hypothetical protein